MLHHNEHLALLVLLLSASRPIQVDGSKPLSIIAGDRSLSEKSSHHRRTIAETI